MPWRDVHQDSTLPATGNAIHGDHICHCLPAPRATIDSGKAALAVTVRNYMIKTADCASICQT